MSEVKKKLEIDTYVFIDASSIRAACVRTLGFNVCRKCGAKRRVQVLKKSTKMKSNVDVYLATDLLRLAYLARKKTHIILVSCDGDYAEMIKSALGANPKIAISVLGTPVVKDGKNTFSMRLQGMRGKMPIFYIRNIQNIQPLIEKQK